MTILSNRSRKTRIKKRKTIAKEILDMTTKNMRKTSDSFTDLVATWIDVLLKCEKADGRIFIARLKGIRGNQLLFENKNGEVIMDSIDSIVSASPFKSKISPEVVDSVGVA